MQQQPDLSPLPTRPRKPFLFVRKRKKPLQNHVWRIALCMALLTVFVNTACFGTHTYSTAQYANQPNGIVYNGTGIPGGTSTNPSFASGTVFNADLYIEPNTYVIITGTIYMGPGTIIHVLPTATLELDGATITGRDTSFDTVDWAHWWCGIEVQGTPGNTQPVVSKVKSHNYSLSPGGSYYNQGALWIHDSSGRPSVVKYSLYGVCAGQLTTFSITYNNGGGLVICENSQFINNDNEAIWFAPYWPLTYIATNYSYASKCVFTYDGSDVDWNTSNLRGFITGARNFFQVTYPLSANFVQNSFSVTDYTSVSISLAAGFVAFYMQQCDYDAYDNHFETLEQGIHDYTYYVGGYNSLRYNYGSYFTIGIYEQATDLTTIANNDFTDIAYFPLLGSAAYNGAGMYLDGAGIFLDQENTTTTDFSVANMITTTRGQYFHNTGPFASVANSNYFTDNVYGIQASLNNTGTLLKCNDLTGVQYYYCVAVSSPPGIAPAQGTRYLPAGNTFSNRTDIPEQDFYMDTTCGTVNYYYHILSGADPVYHSSNLHPNSVFHSITCSPVHELLVSIDSDIEMCNIDMDSLPVPPAGSPEQQDQYHNDELLMQSYIGAGVRALMQCDTVSTTPDTLQLPKNIQKAINFVKAQNNQIDSFLMINLYISQRSYDSASSIITTLSAAHGADSQIVNYCNYYTILIAGIEDTFNTSWQAADTSSLKTMTGSKTIASAKAKALLQSVSDMKALKDTVHTRHGFPILYPPTYEAISGDGGDAPHVAGLKAPANTALIHITAWPDPVTDNLQVEVNNPTGRNTALRMVVSDNLGKTLIDIMVQADMNCDITRQIDMSSLAKGMYFLSVTDNTTLLQKQTIVKQ